MQGILIVDKPMEWTSFDVIAKLRGICLLYTSDAADEL